MAQIHPQKPGRLLRLVGGRVYLLKIAKVLNKMLIHSFGVKVVEASSLPVAKDWPYRLLYWQRMFNLIENVPGDIVECGTAGGSTLAQFAILCQAYGVKRHIWGFDSFEGLPTPTKEDLSSIKAVAKRGKFRVTEEMVLDTLRTNGVAEHTIKHQITLVKGWFSETLPKYEGSIALLRIDGDLYESYKTALENLWPKISVGGIVNFAGYHEAEWPGAKKAVDEYLSQYKGITIRKDLFLNVYFAVKV